jgi:hypothetical protein
MFYEHGFKNLKGEYYSAVAYKETDEATCIRLCTTCD